MSVNRFVTIEGGRIEVFDLDNRRCWYLGRPSPGNDPDIKFQSTMVSRKHGRLENVDGLWFYFDGYGRNGTLFNWKHLAPGIQGRSVPMMLEDGDCLVFGCGENSQITSKSPLGFFTENEASSEWKKLDSKYYHRIFFKDTIRTQAFEEPEPGTIVKSADGIGIYMGDYSFACGDMKIEGA
jgi:pSer/pThr/pTyr-binding forkhead associated (FHA) protein